MKFLKISIVLFISFALSSCEKDLLQKSPLDEVTDLDYFKSPNDLKTYVNQFYTNAIFPRYNNYGNDFNSDNEITQTPNVTLQGTRTVATSGSINFESVRSINYFFDHYKKVEEGYKLADYQQYLGEAYFFRAIIYFNLLSSYGDIQWVTRELGTSSPELYNPRDARNIVTDNIILALDSAAMYLTSDKTRGAGRVNKWMALLMQSRIALYEGTWEKYHAGDPFGVASPQPEKYFTKAVEAATKVMGSGLYDVYSTGKPLSDYMDLFSLQSYASNEEVMFWKEYDNELTRGSGSFVNDRNIRMETPTGRTITKSLADAYLCNDGKPIAGNSLYKGHATIEDEMQNRDPRFSQTIATPDGIWKILPDGSIKYWQEVYDKLNSTADYNAPTGYVIQKGYNPNTIYHVQQYEETPSILYRYAEVLLNFAEAKAELGTITQEDIDKSIKKLRDRVGMPNLVLSDISVDPNWNFPDLSVTSNQ